MKENKTNWTLIAIFALFLLPSLTAAIIYFAHVPLNTKVHATLISPPKLFPKQQTYRAKKDKHTLNLKKKWTLMLVYHEACSQSCARYENLIARIIRATNEKSRRLQQATLIIQQHKHQTQPRKVQTIYTTTTSWFAKITHLGRNRQAQHDAQLLLVDPKQLVMGHYANLAHSENILKDIQHLLKASQIG